MTWFLSCFSFCNNVIRKTAAANILDRYIRVYCFSQHIYVTSMWDFIQPQQGAGKKK